MLWGGGGEGCGCIFSESGWGGLTEKGESELMCRREGKERFRHPGKGGPGRRNSRCKGPVAETCWGCLSNSKEVKRG